ncbi:MAG: hypothetical protein A2Z08_02980 [Deltaproteobacteria bacterium RBG_16_54_11]|jgi:uncharacterized lipoprotein YddW (UPF0748 family)|nr:MAG: hypothetical protein A2Z08_02980 [Deltaproteobacteria bacterium RBG_16_54_11]
MARLPNVLKVLLCLCLAMSGCFAREGRGIWVVRYQMSSPQVLDQVVDDSRQGRFNFLFVQVHGRGDAYYRSHIVPRSEVLAEAPAAYDPLDYVLQRGHAAGLQVHAWLNVLYAWPYPPPYPLSPQHVVNSHPEWLIADDEGRNLTQYNQAERTRDSSEGLYLDPANPLVRSYFLKVCREVVEGYDVDGIHLDFIRYPGPRWGFNTEPLEAFIKRWGVDPRLLSVWVQSPMPDRFIEKKLPRHLRWQYYYYSLWAEQRSGYITELVKELHDEVQSINPHVILSVAVFPDPQVAYYLKGQDWPTWMARGYADLIVPMAYHGDYYRVLAQMAEAKARAQGRVVFAGLGAWVKDPIELQQEVEGLKRIGVDGFSYFSYQGMKECDAGYLQQIRGYLHRSRASLPPVTARQAGQGNPSPSILEADGALLLRRSLQKQFFSLDAYQTLLGRLGITEDALQEQLREESAAFERMTREIYAQAVPSPDQEVSLPRSVEVRSIVRYCHPKDGPLTRQEAITAMQEAYQRLKRGDAFDQVAAKYSQRSAAPEKFYLQDGWDHADIVSSLQEGEITPVIEGPNGYLIYKVIEFHPPERRVFGDLPLWLKRVAFQERLARLVKEQE